MHKDTVQAQSVAWLVTIAGLKSLPAPSARPQATADSTNSVAPVISGHVSRHVPRRPPRRPSPSADARAAEIAATPLSGASTTAIAITLNSTLACNCARSKGEGVARIPFEKE